MLKDLVGPVRAKELTDEFGELIEHLQVLGYKELKPWPEFLSAMKPPTQWSAKHIEQRVTTNFLYYRSNYLIILCAVVIFRIFLSPLTLFSVLLTAGIVVYSVVAVKVPVRVGEFEIDLQKKNALCAGVCLLVLSLSGTLAELLWSIIIAVLLCGAHMLFRARSISSKMNRVQEEVKLNSASGGGGGGVSSTAKIVNNVNKLISEVFSKNTGQNKKNDVTIPNTESDSELNSPDSVDIESRPMPTGDASPYHPSLGAPSSSVGSAVKRASPPSHNRVSEKDD